MGQLVFVFVLMCLSAVISMPAETTTTSRYTLGGFLTQLPPLSDRQESRKLISNKSNQILIRNYVKGRKNLTNPSTVKIHTVTSLKTASFQLGTTHKPQIQYNLTKFVKSTRKPIVRLTQVTKPPVRIKLNRVTTTRKPQTKVTRPKNKTQLNQLNSTTKRPKLRPTASTLSPKTGTVKQNWYEPGVPFPNPQPEIISNSPPFSIADATSPLPSSGSSPALPQSSGSSPALPQPAGSSSALPQPSDAISNAISTFNLNMAPGSDVKDASNPCPSVHISSAVLTPQQRQECSDLNLVINSHFHQSPTDRSPTPHIDTYDAQQAGGGDTEAVEAVGEEGAGTELRRILG